MQTLPILRVHGLAERRRVQDLEPFHGIAASAVGAELDADDCALRGGDLENAVLVLVDRAAEEAGPGLGALVIETEVEVV